MPRFGIEGTVSIKGTAEALNKGEERKESACTVDFEDSMCAVRFLKANSNKKEQIMRIENFQQVDVRIQIQDPDSPHRYARGL